ncbi:hypothetical protein ACHAXS_012048 [Conticribra weissflogii]
MMSSAASSQMLKDLSEQLGHDYSLVEKEGSRLWETLNSLHANDQQGYADFMFQQLQQMESSGGKDAMADPKNLPSSVPPFVPFHGFVVKVFIHPDGKKLFLNICHHDDTIQKPLDAHGQEVVGSSTKFDELRIPVLISKLRSCVDGSQVKSSAVDVVVNSWCIEMCNRKDFPDFKARFVTTALSWIAEEHSIKLQAQGRMPWKIIKSKYKGGFGKDGSHVRPFDHHSKSMVDKRGVGNGNSIPAKKMVELPSDLLKMKEEQAKVSEAKEEELTIKITQAKKDTFKKPLIQEYEKNNAAKKKTPAIKSGFLKRKNKEPLYPPAGSTGDGTSGTGGTLAKFMGKCTVVDTADLAKKSSRSNGECVMPSTHSDSEFDREFHEMCVEDGFMPDGIHHRLNTEESDSLLTDLASLMMTAENSKNEGKETLRNDATRIQSDFTEIQKDADGAVNDITTLTDGNTSKIQINLYHCHPPINDMSELDLQMSESCLILKTFKNANQWKIDFQQPVDVSSVSARFRRKLKQLDIICSLKK